MRQIFLDTETTGLYPDQGDRIIEIGCVELVNRNGVFRSVPELEKAIRDYIDHHNANPKSFVWTKSAEEILEKVARARKSLNKIPSA